MTVEATHQIGFDFDRDGLVCFDATAGDLSNNLIPNPISHEGVGIDDEGGATIEKINVINPYGDHFYRITGAGVDAGINFGKGDDGNTDDIPVDESTEYTAVCWVKGVENFSSVPIEILIRDQGHLNIANSVGVNLSGQWQQLTLTFTTGAGDTHIEFVVRKESDATDALWYVGGFMLVAGATAPATFMNGGDEPNLIPYPVSHTPIAITGNQNGTIATSRTRTPYGLKLYTVTATSDLRSGMVFGRDDAVVSDDIPVTASTEYTFACWVRNVSGLDGVPMRVQINNQVPTNEGFSTFTLSDSWQQVTGTFTADAAATHIYFIIRKEDVATVGIFDVAGLMIVAGDTAPSGFNSGAWNNGLDDLTADLMSFNYRYGMVSSEQKVASPAQLRFKLRDQTNKYGRDGSGIYAGLLNTGTLVQLQSTYNGTIYERFVGYFNPEFVQPWIAPYGASGNQQKRFLDMVAEEPYTALLRSDYIATLLQSVTTDEVLDDIFDSGIVIFPHDAAYWLVDASYLGVDTILFENVVTNFDTGNSTYDYAGDIPDEVTSDKPGIAPITFITDYLEGEGLSARFFWDAPTAKYIFHRRHRDTLKTTNDFSIDETQLVWAGAPYATVLIDGSQVANELTFDFMPRKVGTPASIIYQREESFILAEGESRTITVRYNDPSNEDAQIAAIDVIPPVPGTDYSGNQKGDGTGDDRTDLLGIGLKAGARSAEITIANSSTKRKVRNITIRLRGTPLTHYSRESIKVIDADSRKKYGHKPSAAVILNAVGDIDFANSLALAELTLRSTPSTRFENIVINARQDATLMNIALTTTIGMQCNVSEAWAGHDKDYVIVGIQETFNRENGASQTLNFIIRPLDRTVFWTLGVTGRGELDTNTRLGV